MRVKIGEVIKNIPAEYKDAAKVIDKSFITAENRVRLTNLERFMLAEMAWRIKQSDLILFYLEDMTPVGVEIQVNRAGEARCAVNYVSEGGISAQTIVPSTFRHVGVDVTHNNVNWHKTP